MIYQTELFAYFFNHGSWEKRKIQTSFSNTKGHRNRNNSEGTHPMFSKYVNKYQGQGERKSIRSTVSNSPRFARTKCWYTVFHYYRILSLDPKISTSKSDPRLFILLVKNDLIKYRILYMQFYCFRKMFRKMMIKLAIMFHPASSGSVYSVSLMVGSGPVQHKPGRHHRLCHG
jgi:hypothetical protein